MQVKIQRQLTVVLENYPGRLAAVTTVVAKQHQYRSSITHRYH